MVGGYVDWDETLEQCALRELKEEAQITADHATFLKHMMHWIGIKMAGRTSISHLLFKFLETTLQQKNMRLPSAMVSLDDLPENIAFDHRLMIDDYKQCKKRVMNSMKSTLNDKATTIADLRKHIQVFRSKRGWTKKILKISHSHSF